MKINTLCQKVGIAKVLYNHEIFLITEDSRDCIDNSVFFAIKGNTNDGYIKIEDAIKNGAKTIITDRKTEEFFGINYIYCENPKRMLALFLKFYFQRILKKLHIIGVIGTNGKTTTTTVIYNYLNYIHKDCMLIGSNGCFAKKFEKKHNNTTPKATELYVYFQYAYRHCISYVVMEVSSIAVSELRVLGIPFQTLVFTNFSEDHLDYHHTMNEYLFAKSIPFFQMKETDYIILNVDDAASKNILKHTNAKVITYSVIRNSMLKAENIISDKSGIAFDVDSMHYKTNLLGRFNVYNLLPLFAICKIFNFPSSKIPDFLKGFKEVSGRMNMVEAKDKKIIIDYAHTEEAVRNAVMEAKLMTKNNLYVIVGCGGNREKEKRKKIGKLLNNMNCEIIITSDNPRFENPMKIIEDIKSGIKREATIIENRTDAIHYGLNKMHKDDVLLILGKGCEDYMDIHGRKEKYSDFQVIKEWERDNF